MCVLYKLRSEIEKGKERGKEKGDDSQSLSPSLPFHLVCGKGGKKMADMPRDATRVNRVTTLAETKRDRKGGWRETREET
jgi:hypothetical protein